MFARTYQAELAFLRERGREFADAHPDAARYLGEAGSDPDVERLLEGTAFIAARIRQRLDDGLPDLTNEMLGALLPQAVRPIPALALVQFQGGPHQRDTQIIPAGAALDAVPLAGTACRFRTVHPVAVSPLTITAITIEPGPPPRVRLTFHLPPGVMLAQLGLARVRLQLAGEPAAARDLHLCLSRHDGVRVEVEGRYLPQHLQLEAAGMAANEALLPENAGSHDGQRLLGEWLAFPQRFLVLDLLGLERVSLPEKTSTFTVEITFARHARNLPAVTLGSVLLHTVPVVNLFPATGEPLTVDGTRSTYRLRVADGDPTHRGVYALTAISGRVRGTSATIPFRAHLHGGSEAQIGTWRERRMPTFDGHSSDLELSIMPPAGLSGPLVLSSDLWATNRDLPARLAPGEIRVPTRDVPPGVTFRNLGIPTRISEPQLAGDGPWRLVAQLTADHGTLLSVDGLRRALALIARPTSESGVRPLAQRASAAVQSVTSERCLRHLDGAPIRGLAITVALADDILGGVGDAYLFGSILDAVFAESVTLNAFTRLTVRCTRMGDEFTWPARLGQRKLG